MVGVAFEHGGAHPNIGNDLGVHRVAEPPGLPAGPLAALHHEVAHVMRCSRGTESSDRWETYGCKQGRLPPPPRMTDPIYDERHGNQRKHAERLIVSTATRVSPGPSWWSPSPHPGLP